MSTTELKHIALGEIREGEEALRGVDRDAESYLGLVESIRSKGVMNPINVRFVIEEDSEDYYELIDGLQRFSASRDAGLETIPCQVIDINADEVLESQIIANVHKVDTKPVEYSKALLKILEQNPLLTKSELADKLLKSVGWLEERLGLLKLADDVASLVDTGEIGLSNAYAMAKLPEEDQLNFVDRAMTMPPQEFTPTVNARVKELRDAKRKGKDAAPEEFQPVAILRGRADILSELDNCNLAAGMIEGMDAFEAYKVALKWTLNLDPVSADAQQAKDEERKAERNRNREASKAERTRKRADAAIKKAEELKEEADALANGEAEA